MFLTALWDKEEVELCIVSPELWDKEEVELCIVSPEFPEKLPAAEDVKKVERRLVLEQKKTLNNPTALEE